MAGGAYALVAYALVAYALAACALLLFLLLSRADAKPVIYAQGANLFTDLVAVEAIPEPTLLALLGMGLLSAHLALRRRRRPLVHQINARHRTARAVNIAQPL